MLNILGGFYWFKKTDKELEERAFKYVNLSDCMINTRIKINMRCGGGRQMNFMNRVKWGTI
jgi:hypothetical protein